MAEEAERSFAVAEDEDDDDDASAAIRRILEDEIRLRKGLNLEVWENEGRITREHLQSARLPLIFLL